jgi:integrase
MAPGHSIPTDGTEPGQRTMARQIRAAQLETRTARLKLPPRWKPYTVRIAPGIRLAFRRNAGPAGSWSVIAADGQGGNWMKSFAVADDHEDANGETVLTFWQAQERAKILARGSGRPLEDKPLTVAGAIKNYRSDLESRGGDVSNAERVKLHIPHALGDRPIALLTVRELRHWRNGLQKALEASTVNRIANALRAALNLAADVDERIVSRRAWEVGLQAIENATESRNVILPVDGVRRLVSCSYDINEETGLLVEIAASTGARVSQLRRLQVQDLQDDKTSPRVLVPLSRKGRGQKKMTHRPAAIPESLAARLRRRMHQRPLDTPLLTKPGGAPWRKSDHSRLFRQIAATAGFDPKVVTLAALRHSSIVRQLLNGVPVRLVAAGHDTSVAMVEKTYSKYITDQGDELVRATLPDFSPVRAKVVALPRRG